MNVPVNLGKLFSAFESMAFRVEALPEYRVIEEVEVLRRFEQTGTVPSGFNADWVSLVESSVQAGKRIERLRLVSDPLVNYERFEVLAYRSATAAGQEVRFDARKSHPPVQDFWLFDDTWIAWMNYDSNGSWLGETVRRVDDEDGAMLAYWKSAFASASPDPSAWL